MNTLEVSEDVEAAIKVIAGNLRTLAHGQGITKEQEQALDLEWEVQHLVAKVCGLLRHETVAAAYQDEGHDPREVAAWWPAQVTGRGKAVDPCIATMWRLIDKSTEGGQCDLGMLTDRLSLRPDDEIEELGEALDQVKALAYADGRSALMWKAGRWLSGGWCSDDGFEYFVNGLILLGEQTYYSVLQDPIKMLTVAPYLIDEEFLGSIASDALILKDQLSEGAAEFLENL